MSKNFKYVLILFAAFVGLFVAIIATSPSVRSLAPTPTPGVIKRGNVGPYLYAMTVNHQNNKMAQFDPSLPADDEKVLAALKVLAKDGYGMDIPDGLQPQVVPQDEHNYVTFTADAKTIYFELFKNSSGELGTVRFWLKD